MENGGHDSLSLEFHFGKAIVIFPVVFADWLGQAEDRLSWNSSSSSSMSADLLAAFFGGIVPQSVWAVAALNLSIYERGGAISRMWGIDWADCINSRMSLKSLANCQKGRYCDVIPS